ncbi:MAG: VWA domain-containing protein [Blastocatellia bacterium]|nr:VWA domain-containing protein [Blastocatellia bacterium]
MNLTQTAVAQSEDSSVVKISTTLVQVDALVLDRNGRQVTNLAPGDFQLVVDGKSQTISHFSYVSLGAKRESRTVQPKPDSREPKVSLPPVPLRAEQVQRTIALVIDDLGLSVESLSYLRDGLKRFVNEQMQPNDLVAIVRTGGGVGALQRFTSDRQQLLAAIEGLHYNQNSRVGITAIKDLNDSPAINPDADNALTKLGQKNDETDSQDPRKKDPKKDPKLVKVDLDQNRAEYLAVGTLGAINLIVRGMQGLPGRKAMILVSDGLRIFSRERDNGRIETALQKLTDQANRASVVVHTMDARGLLPLGPTSADKGVPVGPQFATLLANRYDEFWQPQEGLNYLAQQTGGVFFKNNNDLAIGFQQVLEEQNGYYLLGYEPDEATFKAEKGGPAFHKIEVKVAKPGLTVRSRNGFLGIPDNETTLAQRKALPSSLKTALLSPFAASDVRLRMTSTFGNEAKTGTFIRSMVYLDARDLTFRKGADGWNSAVVNVLAVTFKDDDQIIDQSERQLNIQLKDEPLKQALENGLLQTVTLPVKKSGPYQLRIAVKDEGSGRFGSASQFVQIPNLEKGQFAIANVLAAGFFENQNSPKNNPEGQFEADPLASPAVRQLKPGMNLFYTMTVHNARTSPENRTPQVEMQTRLFQDGKLIFTGKPRPVETAGQPDLKRLQTGGNLKLGQSLQPGQYVLQIIVRDKLAPAKESLASQWVDFEVKS